ncbi:Mrp/NBP35 family ATP-binding protein [Novosphingobium bradum]|uniref:Iron-sulfur cluster carrier protein n=1 Tax=Novosphingobium bradum TaxID=1737444 RepID=A0ABV7INL9_9SPHN
MSADAEALKTLLPEDAKRRLSTLLERQGAVTVVLDAGGLDQLGRDKLEIAVKAALRGAEGVSEVRVALTADKAEPAPVPRNGPRIIAVGSGKGGVGKSTLSANLAVALARLGLRVGLVDADIYGPSQPRLMASEGRKPTAHDEKLVPLDTQWGVRMLSVGNLVEPGRAVAWRGPMAGGALGQLMDAHWDNTDVIVIDLPPGTGDVQLTMVQKHKPDGAVIVSTPQDLALIDATRAMNFFEQTRVPVIGMVENMSGYVCPHCGEESDPFGHGGAQDMAVKGGVAFLGHIPLDLAIRQESDAGRPPAAGDTAQGQAFMAVARKVADWLEQTA